MPSDLESWVSGSREHWRVKRRGTEINGVWRGSYSWVFRAEEQKTGDNWERLLRNSELRTDFLGIRHVVDDISLIETMSVVVQRGRKVLGCQCLVVFDRHRQS